MKLFLTIGLGLLVAGLLAGCQMTKSINWNGRVGTYTFDQAVIELGPPDSQAKLSSGWLVAKWISRFSNGGSVVVSGPGTYPYPGPNVIATGPTYYETALVLTFNTNNVLVAWSRR